ncbi:replication protein A 70 kDa DNA-binding subunit C-like [Mercurialis annua]|uniref:replication protein A 70 kDa DNA-binding subunit C-like n=1 Tax=Mercurialis annua TaxID=3986 RepID=UPI00215EC5CC|nr:replication protein A 70 kDa DNA-binding subunit C-like [Mercurialis annua]XP_050221014.1 replication protein A 70 kDa DNA-binding subunit C-like [Mercurialis annua]
MASIEIASIAKDTKNVRLVARVARAWDFTNPHNADAIFSFEFLLIDAKGDTIQGTVSKHLADRFRPLLVEGSIYAISGFIIVPAQNSYRISCHPFRIRLLPNATVRPIEDLTMPIPFDNFNLLSFDDLRQRVGLIDYLCDTVGQLVMMENVQRIRISNAIKSKRTLVIQDASSERIEITLWEKTAINFPEDYVVECAKEGPIIMVIAAVTVKSTYDKAMLSGTSATNFFINPELPEFELFVASLPNPPTELQIVMKDSAPLADPEIEKTENRMTIAGLLQLDFHTDKDTKYTCEAFIKEIDPTDGWWYRACPKCKSGVQTYDQNVYCKKCGPLTIMPVPWYRLTVIAEDGTGVVPFIVFGNLASDLVGLPALTLSIMAKDRHEVPPLMNKICGRTHVFQLRMSDRIQDSSEMSFKVVHIFKNLDLPKKDIPSPPASQSSQLLTRSGLAPSTPSKIRREIQFTDGGSPSASQDVKKMKHD